MLWFGCGCDEYVHVKHFFQIQVETFFLFGRLGSKELGSSFDSTGKRRRCKGTYTATENQSCEESENGSIHGGC